MQIVSQKYPIEIQLNKAKSFDAETANKYGQETPQLQTSDQPTAP